MKSVRAEALGVNRKNIYRKSTRDVKDEELKTTIKKTWETHPAYGHKRLALELKLNKKRVLRVMKKFGIKPPRRKVKQFCTRSTSHHTSQLILTTIKHALQNTRKIPVIFHTDQGTEFMAKKCTHYVESLGILVSTSDTGSPWQNGFQESFFGKFKDEFGDFNRFETVAQLIEEIYAQVHYYNHDRIHTALKMPPARFASLFIE